MEAKSRFTRSPPSSSPWHNRLDWNLSAAGNTTTPPTAITTCSARQTRPHDRRQTRELTRPIQPRNVTDVSVIRAFSLPLPHPPRYAQTQAQRGIPPVSGRHSFEFFVAIFVALRRRSAGCGRSRRDRRALAFLPRLFTPAAALAGSDSSFSQIRTGLSGRSTCECACREDGWQCKQRATEHAPRSHQAHASRAVDASSASMTQQGRIAAALLKAG